MNNRKITIFKVLKRIKKFLPIFCVSMILAAFTVTMNLFVPILVGKAIDEIVSTGNVNFESIKTILFQIALCTSLAALSQWLMNMFNNKITYSVIQNFRNDLFKHIQRLPLKYLDKNQSGNIVSRMITDVDQFSDGLLLGFTQFLTGSLTIIGTLIFMLTISWKITIVVVVITPVSFLVASFIANRTHTMFKQQSEIRGEQTAIIDEAIGELKTVKAFSQEDEVLEKFDEVNERLRACSLKATFFSSITNPATRFVNSLVYSGVAIFGALAAIGGGFTVGALTSFLSYANSYTKPFNEISGVIAELQNALACAERVFSLLEEEELSKEPSNPKTIKDEGEIKIRNVDFSYVKEKELIKDFNLHVRHGQKIAIVGPTGCGKTTMINLLMRFYDVDSGSICVDDVNIKDTSRAILRSSFGMVLQDTWLKSGTIGENIAMSKPNATDDEIKQAAKLSHAHSFIRRLPNKYDTIIGENGGSLSQGQKQLLCIARVMLSLPPMLILDEATSSIDTATEIQIQKAFNNMMKGRTSFIVAHRLSTIKSADVILVMKDGQVIEQGSHDELLAQNGFYTNLYKSQFAH